MDTMHQLSNDSFSYSWLINIKPSFDTLDESFRHSFDGGSFIEMDPKLISMRWASDAHDFDFSLPASQSPVLAHADQIFSNGLLLPLHLVAPPKCEVVSDSSDLVLSRSLSLDSSKTLLSQSNRHQSRYFYTVPSRPISLNSSPLFRSTQSTPLSMGSCSSNRALSRSMKLKLQSLGSCTRSPKKIFRKYLCFLMPLYKKVKGLRLIGRMAGSPVKSVRSCTEESEASSRSSNALSSIDWCRGNAMFDIGTENSIYDAVLHCKKSIGSG